MFNELDQHLQNFNDFDDNRREILCEIGNFAIVNLGKQKSCKDHFDKLRPTLFNILSASVKSMQSSNELKYDVKRALPAFVTIVNTMLLKDECNENVSETFKLFAKHSVDSNNVSSVKMLGIAISNRTALEYADDELKELIELYWNDFREKCKNEIDEKNNRDQSKSCELVLKNIFSVKSPDEWIQLLMEIEREIKMDECNVKLKEHSRLVSSMARCQLNKEKGLIFSDFLKKTLFWIRMNAQSKSTNLSDNFDAIMHLLECYTIFTNNIQVILRRQNFKILNNFNSPLIAVNFRF